MRSPVLLGVAILAAAVACGDGDAPPGSTDVASRPEPEVVINGVALSESQVRDVAQMYKVVPQPGEYWYDGRSGLYGVVGYPAFGFMLPGHGLGKLARDASAGDTGVLINGRELQMSEWAVWSQMVGSVIQPGAYWFDADGNAGVDGNPFPLVNLYAASQQRGYGGSGGDNFWSTRFGAGNYDQGGARGYVSVPGHGPVGYGFD